MALRLDLDKGNIEVIARPDDAVKCSPEIYSEYLMDLDEGKLLLEGEPTRFILKKFLSYGATQRIKNEQVKYSDGQVNVQMGFMMEEVRQALIDIKNPPNTEHPLEFKRDGDGAASKELIATLDAAGILNDLYAARANAASKANKPDALKKK